VIIADSTLPVSPNLFRYGNDIMERKGTQIEGFKKIWIDRRSIFIRGFLSRYFIYVNAAQRPGAPIPSPSVTWIQVWRPAASNQYTLVWQRRVLLNSTVYGLFYTVKFYTLATVVKQESLANAKVSARQPCAYEGL